MPPALDFAALDSSLARLDVAAKHFSQVAPGAVSLNPARRTKLNHDLALAERKLLSDAGLPGRPWVRHTLYAPGAFTGYGASTLPGVREALEGDRFDEAKQQLAVLSSALDAESSYIETLAAEAAEK